MWSRICGRSASQDTSTRQQTEGSHKPPNPCVNNEAILSRCSTLINVISNLWPECVSMVKYDLSYVIYDNKYRYTTSHNILLEGENNSTRTSTVINVISNLWLECVLRHVETSIWTPIVMNVLCFSPYGLNWTQTFNTTQHSTHSTVINVISNLWPECVSRHLTRRHQPQL